MFTVFGIVSQVFVTQAQLDAARGDDGTRLPPSLSASAHWSADAAG